jgi:hypothetical protein
VARSVQIREEQCAQFNNPIPTIPETCAWFYDLKARCYSMKERSYLVREKTSNRVGHLLAALTVCEGLDILTQSCDVDYIATNACVKRRKASTYTYSLITSGS